PADPNACSSLSLAIGYLQRELRCFDYDAIIYCVGYDMKEKADCIEIMLERRVDAILIVGSFFIETHAKNNQCIVDAAKQVPVMLINGLLESENVYSFLCDDCNASLQAVSHLIETGCKNILFLYRTLTGSEQRKLDGYTQALRINDIPVREEYIRSCPLDIYEGRAFLENLVTDGLVFDAIFTTEDSIAMSVLKYTHKNGVSVPDQISVIGYNNSIQSICCYPELSSVDNNTEGTCIAAVSMLLRRFSGGKIPSQTTVSSRIVYRETTR
ncbi:MAG: substrate-binding domain-containing protein, partial [Ruthenibacterium sp.]